MVYHGSRRRVENLDFVGTAAARWAFLGGARLDERFSVLQDGGRVHNVSADIDNIFCLLNHVMS